MQASGEDKLILRSGKTVRGTSDMDSEDVDQGTVGLVSLSHQTKGTKSQTTNTMVRTLQGP